MARIWRPNSVIFCVFADCSQAWGTPAMKHHGRTENGRFEVCGIPPIRDETADGWGTLSAVAWLWVRHPPVCADCGQAWATTRHEASRENGKRDVEVCSIPPIRDETADGWGTLSAVARLRVGHPPGSQETYRDCTN